MVAMSTQLTTKTAGLNVSGTAQVPIDVRPERTESPSQNDGATSVDSEDDDDESDYEDSGDDSDEESDDEPVLGPLQRLSNALRMKQQDMLAKRRHPVLEWKAAAQWHADNAAGWAAAEQEQKHHEEIATEKSARPPITKQKETEFRALLEEYSVAIIKSEKRTELLTRFSIDNRSIEKRKLAAIETAKRADQLRDAAEKITQLEKRDEEEKQVTLDKLQQCMEASNEMGRRYGLLPAINTPAAAPAEEQDETSTVLILRVNNAPLPSDTEASRTPGPSMLTAKRQYFTLNLKRCKHVEELRGERIGDRGAKELARSLLTGACPRVRSIHGMEPRQVPGISALADCFTRGACSQLQELDLRCNNIDSKAFLTLLTALEKGALPELLDIGLQGNILGDEGARALAHAFFRVRSARYDESCTPEQNTQRWRSGTLERIHSTNFRRFCPKLELLDMRRNDAHGALTRSFCPCPPYLTF
ncbi:Leucine-rich repeat domain, L domain-like [Phytophthora cactorum]|nr:Leucine-rich repeat domain, L domain-like [Phytophthora cactorum]